MLVAHWHLEMVAQRLDSLHHCTQAQVCEIASSLTRCIDVTEELLARISAKGVYYNAKLMIDT